MIPFTVGLGITYVFSHNYAKIEVGLYDELPLEKTLTLHNVIILSQCLIRIKTTTTLICS